MVTEFTFDFESDGYPDVKVWKINPDKYMIRLRVSGDIDLKFYISATSAKAFAESLLWSVSDVALKDNPYASDKTKGDAFEALRRAER